MKKIIIIGGVAAGMSAAAKARRLDKEAQITVYEKTEFVSWGACGMPYYVGGFFDDSNVMIARSAEATIKSGIDLKVKNEVIKIDYKNKIHYKTDRDYSDFDFGSLYANNLFIEKT